MTSPSKTSSPTKPTASKKRPAKSRAVAASNLPRFLEPHELLVLPSAQNGAVVHAWGSVSRFGQSDLGQVVKELKSKSIEIADGNMRPVEVLLFDQAMALQTIFTNLSIQAAGSKYLSQLEPLLRMALKAQNQSRMTLETLAVIKNPPVVFARQANINNGGQQQVNNGVAASGSTHASKTQAAPTELSKGIEYVEGMDAGAAGQAGSADVEGNDTGATRAPGGADQQLETVGALNRPAHGRREGAQLAESISGSTPRSRARAPSATQRGDGCAAPGAGAAVDKLAPVSTRSRRSHKGIT